MTHRICFRCHRSKSLGSFINDESYDGGKHPWCQVCRPKGGAPVPGKGEGQAELHCQACTLGMEGRRRSTKYCDTKCASKRALAAGYGLTIQQYNQLIVDCGARCFICNKQPKIWNVDHNHYTNEAYGLVCTACNTKLLAWTFHDPQIAARLLEFLTNPPIRRMFGEIMVGEKMRMRTQEIDDPSGVVGRFRGGRRTRGRRSRKPSQGS